MTNTQNIPQFTVQAPQTLREIFRRTALSFLLFSSALAALLLFSWVLLLPQFTHIEAAGAQRSLEELEAYEADLEEQIAILEVTRNDFLTPVQDGVYQKLLQIKEDRFRFQDVRREVLRTAQTLLSDVPEPVSFTAFTFDAQGQTAEIRGEVRNVGPRSMTVLAQFIDALRKISFVRDVESSRFTREDHGNGVYTSPFTIRLHLQFP